MVFRGQLEPNLLGLAGSHLGCKAVYMGTLGPGAFNKMCVGLPGSTSTNVRYAWCGVGGAGGSFEGKGR